MKRRQFFKQVAATCVAVIMAPAVLVQTKKVSQGIRGDRSRCVYILDEFAKQKPLTMTELRMLNPWFDYKFFPEYRAKRIYEATN